MQGSLLGWALSIVAVSSVAKGVGIKQHTHKAGGGRDGEDTLARVATAEYCENIDEAVNALTIQIEAGRTGLGEAEAKNH